jgi:Nuclease-related domain
MPASTSPDPHFPWEDDEERPGLSIRPLSHADLAGVLARWDHDDADEEEPPHRQAAAPPSYGPQPSVRPPASFARATVGRPGTSALAEYRRRCDTELAAWTRTLPLRLAVTLAAGVAAWLLGRSLLGMPLGLLAGLAAAAVAGWRLRFRASADTLAWRRGAHGERRTARLLDRLTPHGWVVLHDLAVPGSRANLDHLLIGPGGVFVVDSKQYSGRLQPGADGTLWHGRHPLTLTLRAVRFEADRATAVLGMPAVEAVPIVAVRGAPVPWGSLQVDQVTVVAADRLADLLRARPSIFRAHKVAWIVQRARQRFHPAA